VYRDRCTTGFSIPELGSVNHRTLIRPIFLPQSNCQFYRTYCNLLTFPAHGSFADYTHVTSPGFGNLFFFPPCMTGSSGTRSWG
jgi:hypothetical protein